VLPPLALPPLAVWLPPDDETPPDPEFPPLPAPVVPPLAEAPPLPLPPPEPGFPSEAFVQAVATTAASAAPQPSASQRAQTLPDVGRGRADIGEPSRGGKTVRNYTGKRGPAEFRETKSGRAGAGPEAGPSYHGLAMVSPGPALDDGPRDRPNSPSMNEQALERCTSCHGAGESGTDNGPTVCPDCFGEGRQLDSLERTEWRLRDIERAHQGTAHGCDGEVRWLVFELRRTREALLQILSRCQDDSANSSLAAEIQFAANRALGLYGVHPAP
jgi:hypothetical protein